MKKANRSKGTEEYIPCDTLLLSVGLIPENELSRGLDIDMERVTSGPVVNESLETSMEGVLHAEMYFMYMILSTSCQKRLLWQGKNAVKYIKGRAGSR